jgi:hypothetical protein
LIADPSHVVAWECEAAMNAVAGRSVLCLPGDTYMLVAIVDLPERRGRYSKL